MKNLLILFVFLSQITFAQFIEVTSIHTLKGTEEGGFYHPVFSPKGTFLLTTGENYAGLKLHSLVTNEVKTITTDAGAGFDLRISDDENIILFKQTEMIKNLRYTSLHQFNLQDNKQFQVEKATRDKITPTFVVNQPAYVKGNALVKTDKKSPVNVVPFINIEDRKMILYVGTNRTTLTPNGEDASYFWASVSPDQKRIVYTVAARGTFVCNIDGTNVIAIGKINAPVWLNNQWIAGMNDKDDGHVVLSSEIIVSTIDGKIRQTLDTPQTSIAMYPAASADGKHIAFNSGEGRIFILDINIK